MALRTAAAVFRASHRLSVAHRAALTNHAVYLRRLNASPMNAVAMTTTSIGKTKGVDGPEVSSYPASKHLKVPSGLTPEQVCCTLPLLLTARSKPSRNASMIELQMHSHSSSRPKIITGMSQAPISEVIPSSSPSLLMAEYHLLFDDLATSAFNSIDTLAERVRRIGGTTIRSISQISSLQAIKDDNRDSYISPGEMIKTLIEDNYGVLQRQRQAHETCEANKDFPTANILEELMDETERRIWFLKMTSEGGSHQN